MLSLSVYINKPGIIWPIEAQPYWLSEYLSKYLPLTYSTEALRNILEKGIFLVE